MGIIGWIVLGGLAGWLANVIMKEDGGLLKNIILGIIGGLIGGFLTNLIGGEGITGFNIWSFLVALGGALLLIFLGRLISGGGKKK